MGCGLNFSPDAVILDRKGFARANKAYLQGLEMMADASCG